MTSTKSDNNDPLCFEVGEMLKVKLQPTGVFFHKRIPLRDGEAFMNQCVLLTFAAWAHFCALLPELRFWISQARSQVDKFNDNGGGGTEGLPSKTWRLTKDRAYFSR